MQITQILERVQQLANINQNLKIEHIPHLDQGQETIYNLQNKDYSFLEILLKTADIRLILLHYLNDQWHKTIPLSDPNYILRSYSARNNQVAAPMHIDSFIPYQGELAISMQVAIILEDQNAENGCTMIIPGSHQSGEYVTQDQAASALPVESAAGDVIVWDSRVWHGTLKNNSGISRWSLIATFVRWWVKQGYRITANLPQSIYQQLTDNEKAILGFCSQPLDDEMAGIDFKQGYDQLKANVTDYC